MLPATTQTAPFATAAAPFTRPMTRGYSVAFAPSGELLHGLNELLLERRDDPLPNTGQRSAKRANRVVDDRVDA